MAVKADGVLRKLFWWLGLAALAVALALLVGRNAAVLTLFWPPYRFDISLNLALFALVCTFVLLHLALRAFSALRALPAQARRWRKQQAERAAVGALLDALSNQLAGRFVRSQAAAQQALAQLKSLTPDLLPRREQIELLAHLLFAESAHALQDRLRRDQHLQAALAPTPARSAAQAHEGAQLRALRWALQDRDAETARMRLAELPPGLARRTQALRLRLRLAQLMGQSTEALETARLLAKHRAFTPSAARSMVRGLALEALRQTHDLDQLEQLWSSLDISERQWPDLALAAAQRANQLCAGSATAAERARAATLVRDWLDSLWSDFDALDAAQQRLLVLAFEPGLGDLDATWLERLEQAQRQRPSNPFLHYLAGQAFLQRQLWGKAAQLLGLASQSLREPDLLRRTWCALALLAEERADQPAAQAAWKKAALLP